MTGPKSEKFEYFKLYWDSNLTEKEDILAWIDQLPIEEEEKGKLRESFGLKKDDEEGQVK